MSDRILMIDEVWTSLAKPFPTVTLDVYATMPNLIHSVFTLNDGPDLNLPESSPLETVISAINSIATTQCSADAKIARCLWNNAQFWLEDNKEHGERKNVNFEEKCRYLEQNPSKWWKKRTAIRLPRRTRYR